MGNDTSRQIKSVGNAQNAINALSARADQLIDQLSDIIVNRADNQVGGICERLTFIYEDRLKQFNPNELKSLGIRLGLIAPTDKFKNINLTDLKSSLCTSITSYYQRKLNLLVTVKRLIDPERPESSCLQSLEIANKNYYEMLSKSSDQSLQATYYERLIRLNTLAENWYTALDKRLVELQNEVSIDRLNQLESEVNSLIRRGDRNCCILSRQLKPLLFFRQSNGQYFNPYTNQTVSQLPTVREIISEDFSNGASCSFITPPRTIANVTTTSTTIPRPIVQQEADLISFE